MTLNDAFNKINDTRFLMTYPQARIIEGDLGLNTKAALLIAYAAEQTLRLTEKTESLYIEDPAKRPSLYKMQAKGNAGYADIEECFLFNDEKRVSLNDTNALDRAAATWQLAQLNYGIERGIASAQFKLSEREKRAALTDPRVGPDAIPVLKKAAADSYADAAKMLAQEGYGDLAARLSNVAQSLQPLTTQTNDKIQTLLDIRSIIDPKEEPLFEMPEQEGLSGEIFLPSEILPASVEKSLALIESGTKNNSRARHFSIPDIAPVIRNLFKGTFGLN